MNTWRSCLALGVLIYAVAKCFDMIIPLRPAGEFWDMSYYGFAATCDWFLYRITLIFAARKLRRDMGALLIASILANAFGFRLYMAYAPPSTYNWIIQGINYAMAIRLIITGGSDVMDNFDWRGLVRGFAARRLGHQAKEAQ